MILSLSKITIKIVNFKFEIISIFGFAPKESSRKIAIFVRLNEFCMDESQNIEYKAIWKGEYYKWICGFANANGGRIFLGVDDAPPHKPVGLDNADKLMEDLPNKVRDVLGIMVDVNLHHEGVQAVEFALKNGRITNTDVQEMAKVSKPTATRLLTSLSDYLEVKGTTGKGTYYVVKGLTKGSNLSE